MSVDLLNLIWKYFKVIAQWYWLIYSEVKSVKKSLLSLIVKPIMTISKTATDLKNINLWSEGNLLPIKDVEMGFGVKNELKELIKKDNVSAKDVRKFCEESRSVVSGIVIKLFERSPIFCKMVRFTTVFDPAVFLTLDKPPLQKRLKGLLLSLVDYKILSSSQCDSVVVELTIFMTITLLCLGLFLKTLMMQLIVWIISGLRKLRYPILRHWLLWWS